MATAEPSLTVGLRSSADSRILASQWRRLTRVATGAALLTSPVAYMWYHHQQGYSVATSLVYTVLTVIAFRGFVDLVLRRFIPWPSLFAADEKQLKEEDMLARRRSWFWTRLVRSALLVTGLITVIFLIKLHGAGPGQSVTWPGTAAGIWHGFAHIMRSPQILTQIVFVTFLFLANFLISMGPMMLMGISQIRGYEPGDAEWGVKLSDVRGQAEAKEEVRRVVNLWQSGEAFEKAGGKRERGLLFLGAPGTGKTMLAKAIATGFNSPFVSIPGSGFAQTFIGIDALIVRFLSRKAKKLAAKWGGQCIVFIDEIDAVGRRRSALGASMTASTPDSIHDHLFFGPFGALNPSGDVIVETKRWRERMFEQRAPESRSPYPPWARKLGDILNQGVMPGMFGGGGGGQLALNQLLVTMDGIDNPPFMKRLVTNRINSLLDASYILPRRLGKIRLRLPTPRPTGNQIYFIGATNVPIEVLDPALTRPGRLGRHVWFRTPTKEDRKDIFDLYLERVGHDAELDTPRRRDEIARITNGYSPAMIEQICSMALTHAHHEGQAEFKWDHLVEAMTTIESGTAIGVDYVEHETRAVAVHEAGHAAAAHVYKKELESSRLSIRMRGGSLGHHQAFQKEERFSSWQSENMGTLIHTLGAMAAEHVFYGENSNGVGGDLASATALAAYMVGASGMGPEPINLEGRFADETEDETRERIMKRFEGIGLKLMNRTRGGADFHGDPIASILGDPSKRRFAAQILGQAYVTAENFIRENKESVDKIAQTVMEKQELYGDDLVALLDSVELRPPKVDLMQEASWPRI